MTLYNPFTNLNTNYLTYGLNTQSSWFTPQFSSFCWNMPSFLNFNSMFSSFFNPASFMTFDFSKLFPTTNVWENQASIWNNTNFYNTTNWGDVFIKKSDGNKTKKSSFHYAAKTSGNIDNTYLSLSKEKAFEKARKDSNLEELKGGKNWEISEASFKTDIPFAKKGTGKILDKVSDLIGEKLVITSALGTGEAGNPHQKGGYASHHNAVNPKLDIRISGNGQQLAQKLKETGYFSRVSLESDHLDVQINPEKFKTV